MDESGVCAALDNTSRCNFIINQTASGNSDIPGESCFGTDESGVCAALNAASHDVTLESVQSHGTRSQVASQRHVYELDRNGGVCCIISGPADLEQINTKASEAIQRVSANCIEPSVVPIITIPKGRRRKVQSLREKVKEVKYIQPEWQTDATTTMDASRQSKFLEANLAAGEFSPRRGIPTPKQGPGPTLRNMIKTVGSKEQAIIINKIRKLLSSKGMNVKDVFATTAFNPNKEGRRRIIIDSGSEATFVRSQDILNWDTARDASGDGVAVRGFTSSQALPVRVAAKLLSPLDQVEAYYSEEFGEDIMAWNTLESLHEVQIVRDEGAHYLRCVNNVTGEVIRCFKDTDAKNFYTYRWPDAPDVVCFKVSSTLEKAQKLGLSKAGAARAIEAEALHKSLGHASFEVMRKTLRQQVFHDCKLSVEDVDNFEKHIGCIGCEIGKTTREPAVMTDPPKPTDQIGDLVHGDVFNISSEDKTFKTLNFLALVDDYTGYVNVVPLANSSGEEIVKAVKVVANIYSKSGHSIKRIRSDNGAGFTAQATKNALEAMGIQSGQCTAQSHVRKAERSIRHIKDMFRSTLFDLPYLLPNSLYNHLLVYVASSINLVINVNNDFRCPWQLMHGTAPRVHDFLRSSFGQLVTTYNQLNPNRCADDTARADIGIVVGRDANKPGSFWVYDVHDKAIVSRHDLAPIGWTQQLLNNFKSINNERSGASVRFVYGDGTPSEAIDLKKKIEQVNNDSKLREVDRAEDISALMAEVSLLDGKAVKEEDVEYKAHIRDTLSCYNMSICKSIAAVGSEATEEAAIKEIDALIRLNVFKFMNSDQWRELLQAKTNILTSQMFIKQKFDSNNVFEKNKARLVAHGNKQIFDELFSARAESPTVNISVVFAGLAIAAKATEDVDIQVIDVDNAYLNANLENPEYMYIGNDVAKILCKYHPEYTKFLLPDGRLVVELLKALYGLRTAGRDWYNLIAEVLQSHGYIRSTIDKCLFIHSIEKTQIFLYVDDLLVIGAKRCIDKLKSLLIDSFKSIKVKEGPQLSYLGMSVERKPNGDVHVHQRGYIENLAKEYDCQSSSTYPSNCNILNRDDKHEDMAPMDATDYLSLAMKIMFVATRCRPDCLFPTIVLAARCQQPTVEDYKRLLKIVKYLYGSREQSLIFRHNGPIKPRMFVDASFQTHRDARGHSGFVLFLDNISAGILFKSKKQKCVTDSSAEAELISLNEGVKHLIWMTGVLEELGVKTEYPIDVYQDNKSTIQMASNETVNFRGRSKFIDRKYFSVYQHVENNKINLVYVGTEAMVADFFTKAIVGNKFDSLKFSIMGGLE